MHSAGHAVTHTDTLPKPPSLQSRTTLPAHLRHTPTYNTTCNNRRANPGWVGGLPWKSAGSDTAHIARTSASCAPRLDEPTAHPAREPHTHTHHHLPAPSHLWEAPAWAMCVTGLANNTCASLRVRGRGSNAPKQGSSKICLRPSLGTQPRHPQALRVPHSHPVHLLGNLCS